MTLFVVLPVHNRWELTEQFLESLDGQVGVPTDIETLVVDDGSTDQTPHALHARERMSVVQGDGSLWWAGAVQRACEFLTRTISNEDWVYLANNDTVLQPDHLAQLLNTAQAHPRAIVGAVSYEMWPGDIRHPVSPGFAIEPSALDVLNSDEHPNRRIDALAGRGLLMPAAALDELRLSPKLMPQHFADLAMTANLARSGWELVVDREATSMQLARAGSSVEFAPKVRDFLNPQSQLYLPALVTFWWLQSRPRDRWTLPPRMIARAVKQLFSGNYVLRDNTSS